MWLLRVFTIFKWSLPSKLESLVAPGGVLAVGSIAIQLTETIQKIKPIRQESSRCPERSQRAGYSPRPAPESFEAIEEGNKNFAAFNFGPWLDLGPQK